MNEMSTLKRFVHRENEGWSNCQKKCMKEELIDLEEGGKRKSYVLIELT